MAPAIALPLLSLLSLLVFRAADSVAAEPSAGGIYSCVGPNGKPWFIGSGGAIYTSVR